MGTPSEQLAARILDKLVEQKLLKPDDKIKLSAKLAAGTLKAEDWRLAIELAEEKESKP